MVGRRVRWVLYRRNPPSPNRVGNVGAGWAWRLGPYECMTRLGSFGMDRPGLARALPPALACLLRPETRTDGGAFMGYLIWFLIFAGVLVPDIRMRVRPANFGSRTCVCCSRVRRSTWSFCKKNAMLISTVFGHNGGVFGKSPCKSLLSFNLDSVI
jgi:hypothetical protein